MQFSISRISGAINFEAMPVAKITRYPLEPADYKPFTQCILCLGADSLHLRMWAFEVFTTPESEIRCVLHPFEDENLALHIRASACDPVIVQAWVEGGEETPVPVHSHPHNGEDLQGVYWGAEILLPYETLQQVAPLRPLTVDETLPGNFYKLRTDDAYRHMGSFFPAEFPDAPFARASMGEFRIQSY